MLNAICVHDIPLCYNQRSTQSPDEAAFSLREFPVVWQRDVETLMMMTSFPVSALNELENSVETRTQTVELSLFRSVRVYKEPEFP